MFGSLHSRFATLRSLMTITMVLKIAEGTTGTSNIPDPTPNIASLDLAHPDCSADTPWLLDSGASNHFVAQACWFTDLQFTNGSYRVASGPPHTFKGKGTLSLDHLGPDFVLPDSIYCPECNLNVLSLHRLGELGMSGYWDGNITSVFNADGNLVATATSKEKGIYYFLL